MRGESRAKDVPSKIKSGTHLPRGQDCSWMLRRSSVQMEYPQPFGANTTRFTLKNMKSGFR